MSVIKQLIRGGLTEKRKNEILPITLRAQPPRGDMGWQSPQTL